MKFVTAAILTILTTFAGSTPAADGSFEGPLGLQLYSLRNQFKLKGVPRTLDSVKDFGIKYAELAGTYDMEPEKFIAELESRGIKAVSAHFPYTAYKIDPDSVARQAKALGLTYAGCAWADHVKPLNEAQARDIIATFNKAGEALAKVGITFFYHFHGFEFQPYKDGETLADLIIKETNPDQVKFEMDVLWVVFPGHDPVKLLEKYPNRWELMHLKDLRKGIALGELTGKTDVANDVTLGTGQMDWPAILAAAKKVGVKYYFIEDESPTSEAQIPSSISFLGKVNW